jgi:hypothetical protein
VSNLHTQKTARSICLFVVGYLCLPAIGYLSLATANVGRSPVTSLECPEARITLSRRELHTIPESDWKSELISNAITTIDLIDFYRKHTLKQSDDRPSSPIVLALNSPGSLGLRESFHTARIHGVCLENTLNTTQLDVIFQKKPAQFIEAVRNLGVSRNLSQDLSQDLSQGLSGQHIFNSSSCHSKGAMIPSPDPIFQVLSYPEPKPDIRTAMKTLASACGGENHLSLHRIPKPVVHKLDSTAELWSLIQDRFGSDGLRQPIALTICQGLLEKGRSYSGANFPGKGHQRICTENNARAITLVGSRRNQQSKRCEVEVKNPSGHDCGRYSKDFECQSGNLWIDIEALGRNASEGVYLE